MPEKIKIIKLGGEIIEDKNKLTIFLKQFHRLGGLKILVHGGGKIASSFAERLGVKVEMIDGRRLTSEPMREIVQCVYGGLVNKNIVAQLQRLGCDAIGLTGADMGILKAHKREPLNGIDYGFVGEVDEVDSGKLARLLRLGVTPVLAPLTWDCESLLLNTNADTIAREVAVSLARDKSFETEVYFGLGLDGVLKDIKDPGSIISNLGHQEYLSEKANGKITDGMIAKLDNAFHCLIGGVSAVTVGSWENINFPEKGTRLFNDGASHERV